MSDELAVNLEVSYSARELKQRVVQAQANDAHTWLYQSFGKQLFENGWKIETATNLLRTLCGLLSAQHALVAIESAGKLHVHSSFGQTMPVGTRIPMMGILASALKNPVSFALYEYKNAPLWTHNQTNHHDCIVPLALNHQGMGIIAFSGTSLTLGVAEQASLHAVAGMIAMAIFQNQGAVINEADQSLLNTLTPREREILALLPTGFSNIELGEKLGIAPGTAKIHVERVLSKLGVKDRTQAAIKAFELGYRKATK